MTASTARGSLSSPTISAANCGSGEVTPATMSEGESHTRPASNDTTARAQTSAKSATLTVKDRLTARLLPSL